MMNVGSTREEDLLLEQIRGDHVAWSVMGMRCILENKSRYAVLREYGDPRKWDSYEESITK